MTDDKGPGVEESNEDMGFCGSDSEIPWEEAEFCFQFDDEEPNAVMPFQFRPGNTFALEMAPPFMEAGSQFVFQNKDGTKSFKLFIRRRETEGQSDD